MKRNLFLSLTTTIILVGCGNSSTVGETQNDDTTTDTTITKTVSINKHNQGVACLNCHKAPAENADGKSFLSGGTVYTTLDGTTSDTYADGYSIRALLDNDVAINYTKKRGTGNSYSKDSALSSDYNFTAQVLNSSNVVVKSSKKNSHNTTKNLNCNGCHTSTGKNGTLGRVVFK